MGCAGSLLTFTWPRLRKQSLQVLAPGLRIGWVTAAPKLVERIIYHMQGIQLGANSFTQASGGQQTLSRLAYQAPHGTLRRAV